MSTNLIQNYISKPVTSTQTQTKPKPQFDIQQELNNRTFIKPLRAKGTLLNGNIFASPKYAFDNTIYSIKAIKHAAAGNANDHELGKINDVGLVGGGLAIAGYLFTRRTTPLTKGLEFVGLGTFLASMTIWPKVAIQLPAYLIHGVNVQKKYQDSFGRVKPFYQDPQFIPWDLYSDEEIQKIGNRLRVPKDIPNRRDFIQEKMKKIAVQNNTLWMLTAGFAPAIMTGLVCNGVTPYLNRYLDEIKNKKADNILANVEKASKKYQTHPIENAIKEITKTNGNKPITRELTEQIADVFAIHLDPVTSESFRKDLSTFLWDGKYSITEQTAKDTAKNITEVFSKGFSENFLKEVLPNEEQMLQLFRDNNIVGTSLKPVEFKKVQDIVVNEIIKRAETFNQANPDNAEDIKYIKKVINSHTTNEHPIIKALSTTRSAILDSAVQTKLNNTAKIFDDFKAKNLALDEYALIKTGSAPETVIANYWNDVSGEILKTLGIQYKDIEKIRFDRKLMGNLLRERLETIASDKAAYEKVMKNLVEKISTINTKIKSGDINSHMLKGDYTPTAYEEKVNTIFTEYASEIRKAGFNRTADAIVGKNGNEAGSYIAVQKAFAEERMLGVKSSFFRLLNTLDFFRKVADDPNALRTFNKVPREVKEELIEMCKIISLEGHSSDHATKFYMMRNPSPNADTSPLEVKNGKIVNKYFGKANGTTDIPGDKFFYQNGMNFMFGDGIHKDTQTIIDNSSINEEFANYRRLVFEKVGGEEYFWKKRHKVFGYSDVGSDIKFLLTGIAPDELIFKTGQQHFNTTKWLKTFGYFGAGLLGVTVLAQFFFGRMKNPEVKK